MKLHIPEFQTMRKTEESISGNVMTKNIDEDVNLNNFLTMIHLSMSHKEAHRKLW